MNHAEGCVILFVVHPTGTLGHRTLGPRQQSFLACIYSGPIGKYDRSHLQKSGNLP